MKARFVFFLIIVLLINYGAYSQSVNEEEVVSLPDGATADSWSLVYNKTGGYAYIMYDAISNKYSVLYNGKESAQYEYISSYDIKFDSRGNYYVLTSTLIDPVNYFYSFTLIVNGDSVASFDYAEPYNALMTTNDEYKFTVKTDTGAAALTKIVTYTMSGGVTESEGYTFVKLIYGSNMNTASHDEEYDFDNIFKDKEGNPGYIVSDGINASMVFGDKVIKTDFTDMDQSSFTYDKNGELTYVAKIGGQFYYVPGNEFVVQGSKRYKSFDNVYSQILFTSKNVPVYTGVDMLSETEYSTFVVVGDERQKIYLDKDKNETIPGFSGGLYDLAIDSKDNITYYGSQLETQPEGKEAYYSKTAYVVNNVAGKFYGGLGQWKFNGAGDGLASYNPGKDYYTMALLYQKGGKTKQLKNSEYSSILDYGFTRDGKTYYTAMKEGNYEQRVKPQYYVYIDNILIGKYETILYEGVGDNFTTISFDGQGNYAFAVSSFDYYEDGQDYIDPSAYVITNKGKQDPKILSRSGLKDFNYIDNMFYTSNNKLFYIGGTNDVVNNKNYMELIVDGKNLEKVYSSMAYLNYDKVSNTLSFVGARDNKVYNVKVTF